MKEPLYGNLISSPMIVPPIQTELLLPSVFSDNMVLQQKSEVEIWGWAELGEEVRITGSWNNADAVITTANNYGRWKATIKTGEAGGPYTLDFIGNRRITLENVMLGEVWICSGQSNMEWCVNHGVINGEEEAANAGYPGIRIFHIPKIADEYPQRDCRSRWAECSPSTMRTSSAVGYFFGREIHQKLDVPVGLIVSAWGGSPAEIWLRKELVETDPDLHKAAGRFCESQDLPNQPGSAHNGMIAPLVPYGVAGAIWYQGESNVQASQTYGKLFRKLIESWREDFGEELPFYYVQIAPFKYELPEDKAYLLREQQAEAMTIPNTGMVVISDLVDDVTDIHPPNKLDVGKRLANWALAETYGLPVKAYKSPVYKSMKIEKNKIRIFFHNADQGLFCPDKKITHFRIAGDERKFVEAEAKIDGNTIVVSNKKIRQPVAVRFAFDNASIPNLYSKEGLPVSLFRTDNREVEY